MPLEPFDAYKAILEDTNRIADRRSSLESPYFTLITFALAGDAYVFAVSQFDSWLPVIATCAIGILGLAAVGRYTRSVNDLTRILNNRYAWLRQMETDDELVRIKANALNEEFDKIYQTRRHVGRSLGLQRVFFYSFILVPILLAALIFTHQFPEVQQFIHPLTSPK
jgi:hypothetical protein